MHASAWAGQAAAYLRLTHSHHDHTFEIVHRKEFMAFAQSANNLRFADKPGIKRREERFRPDTRTDLKAKLDERFGLLSPHGD